ncbi:DUF6311 domain-containing protein [Plastoroseomonas arctica]|uniref:Uncharacterized protein n=1 Tax=Plastoroseomonas arctica TaxID=1509237 RepID=A0AAF1KJW3_9PROT|nr:DUF6311 domain-containing protein [Plastoroseomonas arctica]MBR0655094.1 hypothetical protein [Plastoroseomonas arctica]
MPPPFAPITENQGKKVRGEFFLPILLGAVAFLILLGPEVLPPWRDGWLTTDRDFATFHLSWMYYRDTPWSWPPAANPRYGIELGSSIFYGDLVPLIAMPMKALAQVLPVGQFVGAWFLVCFVLQAVFAWALLARPGVDRTARVAGCVLLLFAPFLVYRIYQHVSLVAQWIVLAALWLALRPERPRRALPWAALVALGSLLNAYLLVMVAAIWAADWLRRLAAGPRWALLPEAMAMPLIAVAGVWLGGYFFIAAGLPWGDGYGAIGMDLLGPLTAGYSSLLLPDWPPQPLHEGRAVFLGAGGLVVLLGAAAALAWRPAALGGLERFWALGLAILALFAIAVTHRVMVAGQLAFELPIPGWALALLEPLRSSNRFAWPGLYAVLVLAVVLVARVLPKAVSARVLMLAAGLQVGDTANWWVPNRNTLAAEPAGWTTTLVAPFWAEARGRYRRLRQVMPTGQPTFMDPAGQDGWAMLARYAHDNGWDTDVSYHARVAAEARARLWAETRRRIAERDWEAGTLYVVQTAMHDAMRAAAIQDRDLFAEIDGITVFAPGWHAAPTAATPAAVTPPPVTPAAARAP